MRRRAAQSLNPSTVDHYQDTVKHVYGGLQPPFVLQADLSQVSESRLTVVRSATRWVCAQHGMNPEPVLAQLPTAQWRVRTVKDLPTEAEMAHFDELARLHLSPGHQAAVFLPLEMGLRSAEVLSLSRERVERAVLTGELLVVRKGGEEQLLPAQHATVLFERLLDAPKFVRPLPVAKRMALDRARITRSAPKAPKPPSEGPWKTVGQLLSSGNAHCQYLAFHRAITRLGKRAGLPKMTPHLLRHLFATRLIRKGAPLPVVQQMLGHKNIQITLRYVHSTALEAQAYLQRTTP